MPLDPDYVDYQLVRDEAAVLGPKAVQKVRGVLRSETAIEEIRAQNAVIRGADEGLRMAVDRARGLGLSWAEVGIALGITRQAAQQRFASVGEPPDAEETE